MKDSRSPDAPAPIGARNDDSSLFSLDALKKTEDEARKQQNRDDSGLIDLRALAAIERERRPKAQDDMAVASLVAPPSLFSAPMVPLTAPPISTAPPPLERPASQGKAKLFVGAGVAVALVAAIGVFAATRGGGAATPATSAVVVAAPAPTPTAPAAPPEEPKVAALNPGERPAPPPTAAATAPVSPVGGPIGGRTYVAGPRSGGPRPPPPPKADTPPPPKVNACDLACQMQRAVAGKK